MFLFLCLLLLLSFILFGLLSLLLTICYFFYLISLSSIIVYVYGKHSIEEVSLLLFLVTARPPNIKAMNVTGKRRSPLHVYTTELLDLSQMHEE